MVVILSVMQGFSKELEKRLLGFNAHITIMQSGEGNTVGRDELEQLVGKNNLVDAIPFVEGEVIAEAKIGDELFAQGARLRGLDPQALGRMGEIEYYLPGWDGVQQALEGDPLESPLPGIIIGHDMMANLGVHPDFKDKIEVIAPLADVGPTGELEPRLKGFQLVGTFKAGVYEYDTHFALVKIDEAKNLLGAQTSEGWLLRIGDPHTVISLVDQLRSSLGEGWRVEGWHQRNKKLFAALKLERVAMGGVLALVVLIASFSVIGVIMMVVSSKRKDIALLQAMGMKKGGVRSIFLRQGMWIGIVGSALGCLIGAVVCIILMHWPIRLPESYYVETLVVSLRPVWIAGVALLGVALAMCAAIYPLREAVRQDPIVALRYE
jgi:lipoprotein-releasing system permease protein